MLSAEKKRLAEYIDAKAKVFTDASDEVWGCAETRFDLERSVDILVNILESEGFSVERDVKGIPGSFIATYGSGSTTVGFLGEYDALSNLSQESDVFEKRPMSDGGSGHGCGHNALCAGSLAAAVGLKDYIKAEGGSAVVKYFGCPAEESGSGKAFMARAGLFDGLDVALTWHPWTETRIWGTSSLANYQVYFHFKGVSAHAAASPEEGRSALDAAELMSVGVNYLREHIAHEARIHYAYTDAGGTSPNVVQANSSVLYFVRAPKSSQLKPIFERVVDIAKGAALMTGTTVEVEWDSACSEYIINDTLGRIMHSNMSELGHPKYSADEAAYAKKYTETLPESAKQGVKSTIRKYFAPIDAQRVDEMATKSIQESVYPYMMSEAAMPGSTDVGDASWIAPTVQLLAACYPSGTTAHSWQWVASGKSSILHKGLIYAGKVMAMTALDVINDPTIAARAKDEQGQRLAGERYACAIPEYVTPR